MVLYSPLGRSSAMVATTVTTITTTDDRITAMLEWKMLEWKSLIQTKSLAWLISQWTINKM